MRTMLIPKQDSLNSVKAIILPERIYNDYEESLGKEISVIKSSRNIETLFDKYVSVAEVKGFGGSFDRMMGIEQLIEYARNATPSISIHPNDVIEIDETFDSAIFRIKEVIANNASEYEKPYAWYKQWEENTICVQE